MMSRTSSEPDFLKNVRHLGQIVHHYLAGNVTTERDGQRRSCQPVGIRLKDVP